MLRSGTASRGQSPAVVPVRRGGWRRRTRTAASWSPWVTGHPKWPLL